MINFGYIDKDVERRNTFSNLRKNLEYKLFRNNKNSAKDIANGNNKNFDNLKIFKNYPSYINRNNVVNDKSISQIKEYTNNDFKYFIINNNSDLNICTSKNESKYFYSKDKSKSVIKLLNDSEISKASSVKTLQEDSLVSFKNNSKIQEKVNSSNKFSSFKLNDIYKYNINPNTKSVKHLNNYLNKDSLNKDYKISDLNNNSLFFENLKKIKNINPISKFNKNQLKNNLQNNYSYNQNIYINSVNFLPEYKTISYRNKSKENKDFFTNGVNNNNNNTSNINLINIFYYLLKEIIDYLRKFINSYTFTLIMLIVCYIDIIVFILLYNYSNNVNNKLHKVYINLQVDIVFFSLYIIELILILVFNGFYLHQKNSLLENNKWKLFVVITCIIDYFTDCKVLRVFRYFNIFNTFTVVKSFNKIGIIIVYPLKEIHGLIYCIIYFTIILSICLTVYNTSNINGRCVIDYSFFNNIYNNELKAKDHFKKLKLKFKIIDDYIIVNSDQYRYFELLNKSLNFTANNGYYFNRILKDNFNVDKNNDNLVNTLYDYNSIDWRKYDALYKTYLNNYCISDYNCPTNLKCKSIKEIKDYSNTFNLNPYNPLNITINYNENENVFKSLFYTFFTASLQGYETIYFKLSNSLGEEVIFTHWILITVLINFIILKFPIGLMVNVIRLNESINDETTIKIDIKTIKIKEELSEGKSDFTNTNIRENSFSNATYNYMELNLNIAKRFKHLVKLVKGINLFIEVNPIYEFHKKWNSSFYLYYWLNQPIAKFVISFLSLTNLFLLTFQVEYSNNSIYNFMQLVFLTIFLLINFLHFISKRINYFKSIYIFDFIVLILSLLEFIYYETMTISCLYSVRALGFIFHLKELSTLGIAYRCIVSTFKQFFHFLIIVIISLLYFSVIGQILFKDRLKFKRPQTYNSFTLDDYEKQENLKTTHTTNKMLNTTFFNFSNKTFYKNNNGYSFDRRFELYKSLNIDNYLDPKYNYCINTTELDICNIKIIDYMLFNYYNIDDYVKLSYPNIKKSVIENDLYDNFNLVYNTNNGYSPELNYDTIYNSLMCSFFILIGDNWNKLFDYCYYSKDVHYVYTYVYFIIAVLYLKVWLYNAALALIIFEFEKGRKLYKFNALLNEYLAFHDIRRTKRTKSFSHKSYINIRNVEYIKDLDESSIDCEYQNNINDKTNTYNKDNIDDNSKLNEKFIAKRSLKKRRTKSFKLIKEFNAFNFTESKSTVNNYNKIKDNTISSISKSSSKDCNDSEITNSNSISSIYNNKSILKKQHFAKQDNNNKFNNELKLENNNDSRNYSTIEKVNKRNLNKLKSLNNEKLKNFELDIIEEEDARHSYAKSISDSESKYNIFTFKKSYSNNKMNSLLFNKLDSKLNKFISKKSEKQINLFDEYNDLKFNEHNYCLNSNQNDVLTKNVIQNKQDDYDSLIVPFNNPQLSKHNFFDNNYSKNINSNFSIIKDNFKLNESNSEAFKLRRNSVECTDNYTNVCKEKKLTPVQTLKNNILDNRDLLKNKNSSKSLVSNTEKSKKDKSMYFNNKSYFTESFMNATIINQLNDIKFDKKHEYKKNSLISLDINLKKEDLFNTNNPILPLKNNLNDNLNNYNTKSLSVVNEKTALKKSLEEKNVLVVNNNYNDMKTKNKNYCYFENNLNSSFEKNILFKINNNKLCDNKININNPVDSIINNLKSAETKNYMNYNKFRKHSIFDFVNCYKNNLNNLKNIKNNQDLVKNNINQSLSNNTITNSNITNDENNICSKINIQNNNMVDKPVVKLNNYVDIKNNKIKFSNEIIEKNINNFSEYKHKKINYKRNATIKDKKYWPDEYSLLMFHRRNIIRKYLINMFNNNIVETIILWIVFLALLEMIFESPYNIPNSNFNIMLIYIDYLLTIFFFTEFLLRLVAFGAYYDYVYNISDFLKESFPKCYNKLVIKTKTKFNYRKISDILNRNLKNHKNNNNGYNKESLNTKTIKNKDIKKDSVSFFMSDLNLNENINNQTLFKPIERAVFTDVLNIIDATVNIYALILMILTLLDINNYYINEIKSFKALVALRPLVMIKRSRNLKKLVNSIFKALPMILNVFIIIIYFCIILSIIATNLFYGKLGLCSNNIYKTRESCLENNYNWETPTYNYEKLSSIVMLHYEFGTGKDWFYIVSNTVKKLDNSYLYTIYFFLVIFICSFFLVNIAAAVIIDSFKLLIETKAMSYGSVKAIEKRFYHIFRMIFNYKIKFYKIKPLIKRNSNNLKKAVYRYIFVNIYFKKSLIFLNILNTLSLGLINSSDPQYFINIHFYIFIFYLFVVLIEESTNMYIYGIKTIKNNKNLLFNVVNCIVLIVTIPLEIYFNYNSNNINEFNKYHKITLIFRISRFYKLFKLNKCMNDYIKIFKRLFSKILLIGVLLCLAITVYGVMGMAYFGRIKHEYHINYNNNFETFINSVLILLKCLFGSNWNRIMRELGYTYKNCSDFQSYDSLIENGPLICGNYKSYIYFVSFNVICQLLILNLFVAIFVEFFSSTFNEQEIIDEDNISKLFHLWYSYDVNRNNIISYENFVMFLLQLPSCMSINNKDFQYCNVELSSTKNNRFNGGVLVSPDNNLIISKCFLIKISRCLNELKIKRQLNGIQLNDALLYIVMRILSDDYNSIET